MPSNSISVLDLKTGATAELEISAGSCISSLPFAKLNPGKPIRILDPGFKNTIVSRTAVSRIDAANGIVSFLPPLTPGKLYYRGYDLETLVEKSSFLEVSYLLIYGNLPNKAQSRDWEYQVMHHTYIHVELETQMSTFRFLLPSF
jgi:citrate synthase